MNWTKTSIFAATGLVGAGLAAMTLAQGAPSGGMGMGPGGMGPGGMGDDHRPAFETLDTDGDGAISVEEFRAHQAAHFAERDANGDGALDSDELVDAMTERARERATMMIQRMLTWHDANGDGMLGQDEMPGDGLAGMMLRLDADGDGRVTAEEFDKIRAGMERRAQRGQGGQGGERSFFGQGRGGERSFSGQVQGGHGHGHGDGEGHEHQGRRGGN